MYERIPKPPLCPMWKFCQNHRWILFRYVWCFIPYRFTRDQIISIRTRDSDMWSIFLWRRNWWSCDLWFCAHYQALPISYIWKLFNILKHWSIRLWKSKQIIDMRNKHIETYDYLRISYKNGRSRIWFLPFLTSFKVNPLNFMTRPSLLKRPSFWICTMASMNRWLYQRLLMNLNRNRDCHTKILFPQGQAAWAMVQASHWKLWIRL